MFTNPMLQFEERLYDLINNCGLTIGEAYYIVNNASLELKLKLYEIAIKEQNEKEEDYSQTVDLPFEINEEKKEKENE